MATISVMTWRLTRLVAAIGVVAGLLTISPAALGRSAANPTIRVQFSLNGTITVTGPTGAPLGTISGSPTVIPAGYYTRVGIIAAVGSRVDSAAVTGRVDVIARFLLDPFRQSRWGLSAGGGLTLGAEQGDRVRPALVAVIDLEGPRTAYRFSPAIQVGLGNGTRVGVVLRWNGRTAR